MVGVRIDRLGVTFSKAGDAWCGIFEVSHRGWFWDTFLKRVEKSGLEFDAIFQIISSQTAYAGKGREEGDVI